MLILSLRKEKRIRVRVKGVEIWISVARGTNGDTRLAFDCPPEVEIMREELLGKQASARKPVR